MAFKGSTNAGVILVLGATGGQGGAVVDALLAEGAALRTLVRSSDSANAQRLAQLGVELVAGDLTDRASLAAAMREVSAAFALTTPFQAGLDAEVAQGLTIVAAARETQLPYLVFSSVASANQQTGVPHFESKAKIEAALSVSGVPFTILGPTYFYDNLLGSLEDIAAGQLALPLAVDRPLQQLARADLGRFAATALLTPAAFVGQRIELASDAPTSTRMAATVHAILGCPVEAVSVPVEAIRNDDMRAMWAFLNDPGYQVDIPALHAAYPDIGWTSFWDWARRAFNQPPPAEDQPLT
jgi:uncharacterized protein YbjT (DUF2867 family)